MCVCVCVCVCFFLYACLRGVINMYRDRILKFNEFYRLEFK